MNVANVKLDDVAEFTNGGAWSDKEYVDYGVPVTRISDFVGGTINLSGCKYLPQSSLTKYKKHELSTGDLVIAMVGSHIIHPNSVVGRAVIVPKSANGSLLNQNAVRIRSKSEEFDKSYLAYLGQSHIFRSYIIAHARGAANQVRMSLALLKEMPIALPKISNQRTIAGILSTYDDLIENNTRRIQILEETSRRIYEEWFVWFRFPGHEHVKVVESELGLIPDGWKILPIMSVASIKYGRTLPKNQMQGDGNIPVYGAGKIIGLHDEANRIQSVLITGCRGSCGEMTLTKGIAFITNNSLIFDCPNNLRFFLYQYLKRRGLKDCVGGAAQPQITLESISRIKIIIPPVSVLEDFDQITSNFVSLAFKLEKKNESLRATRDLLLPKLISGELELSNFPEPVSD